MRPRAGLLAATALFSLPTGIHAAGTGGVSSPQLVGLTGDEFVATIAIDPGPAEVLGSYGATLQWDPAILQLQGYTGGLYPFEDPVVNLSTLGQGRVEFADAAPGAPPGRVEVIRLRFRPMVMPPATTVLDVEFSSLYGGGTFDNLLPELQVEDGSACVADFAYHLNVRGAVDTFVDWSVIPTAVSYDVIRGDLDELSASATVVFLGSPVCVENGSADTTTDTGTEPANPDTAVPPVGKGFFYVVRFSDGGSDSTLGFTRDCVLERTVSMGGCS